MLSLYRISNKQNNRAERPLTARHPSTIAFLMAAVVLVAASALPACLETGRDAAAARLPELIGARYSFSRPEPRASVSEKRAPLEDALFAIEQARFELVIWAYGFDEPELIRALREARGRGVHVRIIGSADQGYEELKQAGFFPDVRVRTGIQHVKLIVSDRDLIFAGTGNFTSSDLFRSNNAFVLLPLLPGAGDEIVALFNHETTAPARAPIPFPQVRLLGGSTMGRSMQLLLIDAILSARHTIRYLIFSHTDPLITAALALQAARGISVEGIYDDESESGALPAEAERWNATLGALPAALYVEGNRMGIPSESGFRSGGKLHHKTVVIDDARVLTGSYNWSLSARDRNLELLLDIRNHLVALEFMEEFERIKRTSLIKGRSPGQQREPVVLSAGIDTVCTEAPGRVTLFSGTGTHRMIRDVPALAGCSRIPTSLKDQAGFPSIGGPRPPELLLFDLQPARDAEDTAAGTGTAGAELPCAKASDCRALDLERSHAALGILRFSTGQPEAGVVTSITLVTRAQRWLLIPRAAPPQTLVIEPWSGDALFFLHMADGSTAVACAFTGSGLDAALENWLDVFVSHGGSRPRCIKDS